MADPLSVSGSVVGILSLGIQAAQILYDFYTTAKDQHSDIAHTIHKLESVLSLLETLKSHLASRRFRPDDSDVLTKIEAAISSCEECVNELHEEASKFSQSTAGGHLNAAKATMRQVAYPFRRSTLVKLDENVDETSDQLSQALQLLQSKDLSRVRDEIEDTKALLVLIRAEQIDSSIRDWLRAPDASINFNDSCKKRHHGTGAWFVKGDAFIAWLTRSESFLWLNGFAGCGKSVLCSTVIQHVFRHRRSNARVGIASFFFTFNDESKQSASSLLRALVLQLSSQLGDRHQFLSHMKRAYCHAAPTEQALLDCLHQLIRSFQSVYIILDALDESPRDANRWDVLQVLVDIRAWHESTLHILVTSRDEPDIREELDAAPEEQITLRNEQIDRDITSYISQHLRENRRLRKWEEHYDLIQNALTERANGVFRWVECQFRSIIDCPQSEDLLDQLLVSLPRSLDETYERMLLNIPHTAKSYARRMLCLLCGTKRPFTLEELIDGIAVELDPRPSYNRKRRLKNAAAIQQVCPGFLDLDLDPKTGHTLVRIAHFSVQEYLESERISQQKASSFSMRRPDVHREIARICLTVLLEPAPIGLSEYSRQYPIASYAAKYWSNHYKDGTRDVEAESQALLLMQNRLERWVSLWNLDREDGKRSSIVPTSLYYASSLGLYNIVCGLIVDTSADVNAYGGTHGTALQAAAAHGHKEVVQLLIDRGANVNAKGGADVNALQAAVIHGHKEAVQLLLNHGANVNDYGGHMGYPLFAALHDNKEEIVQLLLDGGASVHVAGGVYGTALVTAAIHGSSEVIQLLLDRGANVNTNPGRYGSALHAALAHGRDKEVIKLLIDRGADVNAFGGQHNYVLRAAKGDKEIIQLLLDRGADGSVL